MPQSPSPLADNYFTDTAVDYLRRWFRGLPQRDEPGIQEEQDRVVVKAGKYDTLEGNSGWAELLEYFMARVNQEITEATADSLNPEKQRIHVIRWNAMRELLDSGLSELKDTRRERDRIMEQRREDERDGN